MFRALAFLILGTIPFVSPVQAKPTTILTPDDAIVVSRESLADRDPYTVIWSNIDFVNALFEEQIRKEEVSRDALMSYYVDYYLAQMSNGGFSQFVYNSKWDSLRIEMVRAGLKAIGAKRHLALFEEEAASVSSLGKAQQETFLSSEYFGANRLRDQLSSFDGRFFELKEQEDLIALNSRWLRANSKLVAVPRSELSKEVERRAAALPDRAARKAQALAAEPRYMKLIRALCARSGQELKDVTSGNPNHKYLGNAVLAWNFITDKGHHFMIEANGKAMMFEGESERLIAEIDAR